MHGKIETGGILTLWARVFSMLVIRERGGKCIQEVFFIVSDIAAY